jgi:ribosomal protein S18 acetylase RimI-like enzyme
MSQARPNIFTEIADESAYAARAVVRLVGGQEGEALAFLAARPVSTFIMAGYIRDNGLESPRNRGDFYACRDAAGNLTGVAMFGHATIFEARTGAEIVAFARFARALPPMHFVAGEPAEVELFWKTYARPGDAAPNRVPFFLYELRHPIEVPAPAPQLRPAELSQVEQVARVHADIAVETSGVNPMEIDREGFLRRTAERIAKGRVWVCADGEQMNFKADVVSEMPDVIYLEGVYVAPSERGKGFGLRCLARLCAELLKRARAVTVLVVTDNAPAVSLYKRAGFRLYSNYLILYPQDGAQV